MRIAVIGAGPVGLSAALALVKHEVSVDIYEATDKVGGMCCSIELWNQKVDLGPHRFFSNDKRVNEFWLDVVGDEYEMVNRQTRIFYKNKFFDYPLKIGNVLSNLGLIESAACVISFWCQKIYKIKDISSFENWVKSRFGNRLYRMFFKTYTEKLWGINCTDLDAAFAAQRIKKLSMYEAVKNAVLKGRGNVHKTLVDEFAYPFNGTGSVYEKMADLINSKGSNIYMNTPVYRILTNTNSVTGIELLNGTVKNYDHIVSSMPYTSMVERLPSLPDNIMQLSKQLTYRNTILVYLLVDSVDLFKDNWLYIHSDNLQMGRITNFRNWSSSLYGKENKSILALEYWCNTEDEMWAYDDNELINLASSEIDNTGLVSHNLIEDGYVYRMNKSYPVYSKGYKEILEPVEQYVSTIKGLYPIGRYGSFKYNNQDHSILMGLMAAENILGNANHNLNEINSDYDTYQESYIVTKTGLVKQ
nr:FAD-dependent oxidoreductase [uncultured Carboxylicivirga sp.]